MRIGQVLAVETSTPPSTNLLMETLWKHDLFNSDRHFFTKVTPDNSFSKTMNHTTVIINDM